MLKVVLYIFLIGFRHICFIEKCLGQEPETKEEKPHLQNLGITQEGIKSALYEHQIIPDVLETVPEQVLKVEFNGKNVFLGTKLELRDIQAPPSHVTWNIKPHALYTLILSGPDYPARIDPREREYPHWVLGNIQGNNLQTGETVMEYEAPPSSYCSGNHRFVFTLFEQNGTAPIEYDECILRDQGLPVFRKYFVTKTYGRKYRMEAPVGVNFFEVEL